MILPIRRFLQWLFWMVFITATTIVAFHWWLGSGTLTIETPTLTIQLPLVKALIALELSVFVLAIIARSLSWLLSLKQKLQEHRKHKHHDRYYQHLEHSLLLLLGQQWAPLQDHLNNTPGIPQEGFHKALHELLLACSHQHTGDNEEALRLCHHLSQPSQPSPQITLARLTIEANIHASRGHDSSLIACLEETQVQQKTKHPLDSLCQAYCRIGAYDKLQQYLKSFYFLPNTTQTKWQLLSLQHRFQQYLDKGQYLALEEAYDNLSTALRHNDGIQALAIKAALLSGHGSRVQDILIPALRSHPHSVDLARLGRYISQDPSLNHSLGQHFASNKEQEKSTAALTIQAYTYWAAGDYNLAYNGFNRVLESGLLNTLAEDNHLMMACCQAAQAHKMDSSSTSARR